MIKFIFTILIFSFLVSCQSMKDGIALKKKEAADEFLVEKKNPLVQPPRFGQLPVPGEKSSNNESSTNNIEKIQKRGKVIKAPSIEMDSKDFGIGAQILHDLNINKLMLISNSKHTKRVGMIGYGLEIVNYINY